MDCLKVLYSSFDFVFLFDHFYGHKRSSEVGLKESITRKYFGGKQQNMIDTVMLGEDVSLRPYDYILATGNTQNMWWDPDLPDSQLTGPNWISYIENPEHYHDFLKEILNPTSFKTILLTTYIVQELHQRDTRLTLLEIKNKMTYQWKKINTRINKGVLGNLNECYKSYGREYG